VDGVDYRLARLGEADAVGLFQERAGHVGRARRSSSPMRCSWRTCLL
jgi:hypothetical protein